MLNPIQSNIENFRYNPNIPIQNQNKIETIQDKKENLSIAPNNNILGKDSFLKILIKQLEHQDPLNPAEDKQFIAQMAQFSSLEQMKNIADEVRSLKNHYSYGLVGKYIEGKITSSNQEIKGIAEKVYIDNNNQVLITVNKKNIKLSEIHSVSNQTNQNMIGTENQSY